MAAMFKPIRAVMTAALLTIATYGVAAEMAGGHPDTYVVKRGDTLWDISGRFLQEPWRWPEVWRLNRDEIRNPHLIFPGQVLYLVKKDGRATLQMARPGSGMPDNTVKLSPRVRSQVLDNGAIAAIPLHLIGPFLTEAVVFDTNELDTAPRIVATHECRVMVSRGETAYVRGDLGGARDFRLFRELRPALFVSESTGALKLLEIFREEQQSMALVVDEYGEIQGLVTQSDLMGAVVGRLQATENTEDAPLVVVRDDGSLLVDGSLPNDDLRELLGGVALPDDDEYNTLAGMMIERFGRIPHVGERLDWAGWRFEVVDLDGARIDKLLLHRLPDADDEDLVA